MKRIILLPAIVLMFATFAFAQPKTVTDYYLALPDKYFSKEGEIKNKAALTKYRKSIISIEDIKNGYLKILSNDFEGVGEIALFKKTDGSYIVALAEAGCGPVCGGDVTFWTYKAAKWTDVTKQVFQFSEAEVKKSFAAKNVPESDQTAYFQLPREGRTMKFICDDCDANGDGILAQFEWNGTKFVKK